MRRLLLAIATASCLPAQPEPAKPLEFEVASVKLHPVPPGRILIRMPSGRRSILARGDRFSEDMITLNELIMDAYDVKDYQIAGAPDWAIPPIGDRYDIAAKTDGIATESQLREMLRTLLADRFKLKLHREMKDLPVYALVIGKGGKLREISEAELAAAEAARRQDAPTGGRAMVRPLVSRSNIFVLARLITNVADRPVIDETGLTGTYEYTNLDWGQFARDKRADPLEASIGPSIFTAIQQELGLKLEPRKDRVEVLVIEHAAKPTEN